MFTWCTARSPAEWDEAWAKAACALFLAQTGETYTPRSLASLPVPTWDGNLMLLEHGPDEALTEVGPDRLRGLLWTCLLYTSPSPRDATLSRMPSSA